MGNCTCCYKNAARIKADEEQKERLLPKKPAERKSKKVTEKDIDRIIRTFDGLGNPPLTKIVQNWQGLQESEKIFKQLLGVDQNLSLKKSLLHLPKGYRILPGDSNEQGRLDFLLSYQERKNAQETSKDIRYANYTAGPDQEQLCQAFRNISVFIDLLLRSCRELRTSLMINEYERYLQDIEHYIISAKMECIYCHTEIDEEELENAAEKLANYADQFKKVKRKRKSTCAIL